MEVKKKRTGMRTGMKDNCQRKNGAGTKRMRRAAREAVRALAAAGRKRRRTGGENRMWIWKMWTTQITRQTRHLLVHKQGSRSVRKTTMRTTATYGLSLLFAVQ